MTLFRQLVVAAAVALSVTGASYATTTPAMAQDVDIHINIPGIGVVPGYVYGGRRYISCRHGARIVDRRGYNRVRPVDCSRPFYRYQARRAGLWWIVRLNARNGNIVGARPL